MGGCAIRDKSEAAHSFSALPKETGILGAPERFLKLMVVSIRPRQWYKNVLVFAGIVFSANLLDASMWATTLLAFAYFCMLSGAEYVINDILDREKDRLHPVKSLRPIASGQLRGPHAFLFALLLVVTALLGSYFTINLRFFVMSASFLLLVTSYSLFLKRQVIADVIAISAGFVIRAVAGAMAIDVRVSPWLIVCTFLLALFLAFGKRWHEIGALKGEAINHRHVLGEYSQSMLQELTAITAGSLVVSYLLYCSSTGDDLMLITAPLAVYGLFRYLYLLRQDGKPAEPEAALTDRPILASLALWALAVVSIMLHSKVS